ncbi:MAG: hypothetical protein ACRDPD_31450 [Streptosporangiaceae bacterium]
MAAGHGVQLADARGPGQDGEQHAADGRQEHGHAEREVPVHAQVGDAHLPAVLQDEDEQEQQDDGEERDREPQAADPGMPDLVLRQRRRCHRGGLLRRRAELRVGGGSRPLGAGLRFCAHGDPLA